MINFSLNISNIISDIKSLWDLIGFSKKNKIISKLEKFKKNYDEYKWENYSSYESCIINFINDKPLDFIQENEEIIFQKIIPKLDLIQKEEYYKLFSKFADFLWYTSEDGVESGKKIHIILLNNLHVFFPENYERQKIESLKRNSYLNDSVDVRSGFFNELVDSYPHASKPIRDLSFCLICRLIKNTDFEQAEDLLQKYYNHEKQEEENFHIADKYFQWGKFYYHRSKANLKRPQEDIISDINKSIDFLQKAKEKYDVLSQKHIYNRFSSVYLTIIKKNHDFEIKNIDKIKHDALDFVNTKVKRYCVLDTGLRKEVSEDAGSKSDIIF